MRLITSSASFDHRDMKKLVRLIRNDEEVVNQKNKDGLTLLMCVFSLSFNSNFKLKIVDALLENGSDINAIDYERKPTLMYLLERKSLFDYKDLCVFKYVLSNCNINLNIQDRKRRTLISHILSFDYNDNYKMEIVERLLYNGALIKCFDIEGKTPLMHLVLRSSSHPVIDYRVFEFIIFFIKDADFVNKQDDKGQTLLMYSVLIQNAKIVRLLLVKDACIWIQDYSHNNALNYAFLSMNYFYSHNDEEKYNHAVEIIHIFFANMKDSFFEDSLKILSHKYDEMFYISSNCENAGLMEQLLSFKNIFSETVTL